MKKPRQSALIGDIKLFVLTFVIAGVCLSFLIPLSAPFLSAQKTTVQQPLINAVGLLAQEKQQSVPGIPVQLLIPAIHVDAPVEQVGLTKDGNMDVPQKWEDTGWYSGGPRPGSAGNAVIAGHLDSETAEAVFWHLKKLKPGDMVQVKDDKNQTWNFRVTETKVYKDNAAPLDRIFGPTTNKNLNLVTCGGTWSKNLQQYDERLAVYTELVE